MIIGSYYKTYIWVHITKKFIVRIKREIKIKKSKKANINEKSQMDFIGSRVSK